MKLQYETGIATLVQFMVLGLLNIAGTVSSTVGSCRKEGGECATEIFASAILFLLLIGWLGLLYGLGFAAQEKRSRRLSQALIAAEGLTALVSLVSFKYPSNTFGQLISLVALVLSLWVILLAYRLMRAGNKRITRTGRQRRRTG